MVFNTFFSNQDDNNCEGLIGTSDSGLKPWPTRVITGENMFTARIGPTGGKRGYTPITGIYFLNQNCICIACAYNFMNDFQDILRGALLGT